MSNKSKSRKKRLNPNLKWGIALFVEIVVLVVMTIAYISFWLGSKYEQNVQHMEIDRDELAINEGANEAQKGYKTIALFGVDARDTSLGAGNRSDAIMIASINNDTKEVRIVSVYRDTLLEIEDGSGITAKVNAAYAYGGPELAVKTLNANLDLEITEFITVNWHALTLAIDELGGVTVGVEENELAALNMCIAEQLNTVGGYSDGVFETGNLRLNGTQATAYARIRSTDQGDITRTERQREVLQAMIKEALKSDMKTINSMLDVVFPNILTSISKDEMSDMISDMFDYKIVATTGFPFTYSIPMHETKGSIVVATDLEMNVSALHYFLFGTENYVPTQSVIDSSVKIEEETWQTDQPIDYTTIPGR
ncbi:MAG: LytR family transcriptional regulator [Lachnospiraceae bacterium]|nr:LytR family transcriptional regulator [Lachnospiraceae bacterium]